MGKRRTKKQKESAKHLFTLSWEPATSARTPQPSVKGQFENTSEPKIKKMGMANNAEILAKDGESEAMRQDVIKSLILASLILGTELVIYLGWS